MTKVPRFGSRRRDSHGVVHTLDEIILEKPIARLPEASLATHLVELQVELRLLVCRFRHGS